MSGFSTPAAIYPDLSLSQDFKRTVVICQTDDREAVGRPRQNWRSNELRKLGVSWDKDRALEAEEARTSWISGVVLHVVGLDRTGLEVLVLDFRLSRDRLQICDLVWGHP